MSCYNQTWQNIVLFELRCSKSFTLPKELIEAQSFNNLIPVDSSEASTQSAGSGGTDSLLLCTELVGRSHWLAPVLWLW